MVTIDHKSGFCFGVIKAIQKAEEELRKGGILYCLGDIVHNEQEVKRLASMGLKTVDYEQFEQLHNVRVLLRAHGEPPSTYETAKRNNIEIIDASCPVVRHLQDRIRQQYQATNDESHIVIYGTRGHAEVVGLAGQTDNKAIIVEKPQDLQQLDYKHDIYLYSQTTKSIDKFQKLVSEIENKMENAELHAHDTICRQVANRTNEIKNFALQHDIIIFVGGKKSSNAKELFAHCQAANTNSFFVSDVSEIDRTLLHRCKNKNVGICGATSTPLWLMEQCKIKIENFSNNI